MTHDRKKLLAPFNIRILSIILARFRVRLGYLIALKACCMNVCVRPAYTYEQCLALFQCIQLSGHHTFEKRPTETERREKRVRVFVCNAQELRLKSTELKIVSKYKQTTAAFFTHDLHS